MAYVRSGLSDIMTEWLNDTGLICLIINIQGGGRAHIHSSEEQQPTAGWISSGEALDFITNTDE